MFGLLGAGAPERVHLSTGAGEVRAVIAVAGAALGQQFSGSAKFDYYFNQGRILFMQKSNELWPSVILSLSLLAQPL